MSINKNNVEMTKILLDYANKNNIIIDINEKKAEGEALDMMHAMSFMTYKTLVRSGSYSDCKDADALVITASVPMDSKLSDRMELLNKNKAVMKSIVSSRRASVSWQGA